MKIHNPSKALVIETLESLTKEIEDLDYMLIRFNGDSNIYSENKLSYKQHEAMEHMTGFLHAYICWHRLFLMATKEGI